MSKDEATFHLIKLSYIQAYNAQAHASNGCACTLDGVKNVEGWTNGQGDSRSRILEIFSIKYQISVMYKGNISWIFFSTQYYF